LASWYGEPFHGRLTANGETYDMYQVSAAHKTLPLGSRVRVTNRKNGKSLILRINDRGPFVRGRIIDLSYAGARDLGMVEDGVVPVRVETLELGDNRYVKSGRIIAAKEPMSYTVQVGSFAERENALQMKQNLDSRFEDVFIREWNDRRAVFYRVRIGRFSREADARKLCSRLLKDNYSAYVIAD
jgi:rare lipoprotein A